MTETLWAVLGYNAYSEQAQPRLALLCRDKTRAETECRLRNNGSRGMRYRVQKTKIEGEER